MGIPSSSYKYHEQKQMFFGVLCAVVIQIVPVVIYVGITSININHPIIWLWTVTSIPLSIRFWASLIPIFLPMLLIGYVMLKSHSNPTKLPTTRFNAILCIFSVSIALKSFAFLILSILLPFTYAYLRGQLLYQACSARPELRCLNPNGLYVLVCGIWVGLYFFVRYQLFPKQIRFPLIIQLKSYQIRYRILPAIKNSFRRTFTPVVYFIAIFYLSQKFIIAFVIKIYSCRIDPENDNFLQFLHPLTLFQAWLMASVVHFSMWSLVKCLKVFLTEEYPFPIPELISSLSPRNPFQQQHAFYRLYLLSTGRVGENPEVFSLSQPGGIPHTWHAILQESLRTIKDLQISIETISGSNPTTESEVNHHPPSPILSQQNFRLRRLVDSEKIQPKKDEQPLNAFTIGFHQIINSAVTFAPIKYIFSPTPEEQISSILEGSQHVVWAIESLAIFTGRAIKEDKFGVVVNDIPSIVTSFLSFRSTLEKTKIGGPGKQRQRDRPGRMRAALLCAVNRGLCRIAVTYTEYLDHLYLPPDAIRALKMYVS